MEHRTSTPISVGYPRFNARTTDVNYNLLYILLSYALALCAVLPATFLRRRNAVPPLAIKNFCRSYLLALLSCGVQTSIYTGIQYWSPTLCSAMLNLTPAFIWILAAISRVENWNLKLQSIRAKLIGTVVSIIGALIVAFYKGLPETRRSIPHEMLDSTSVARESEWLLGGFLLAFGTVGHSDFFIVQTRDIKDNPPDLMVTSICCSFVVISAAILALIAKLNPESCLLRPDMELLAIIYSAFFVISLRSIVYTRACHKKGPVYVAMFNPLEIIIAIGIGIIFLGDALHLGSLIGLAIIAIGFYAAWWGQVQEKEMEKTSASSMPKSCQTPSPESAGRNHYGLYNESETESSGSSSEAELTADSKVISMNNASCNGLQDKIDKSCLAENEKPSEVGAASHSQDNDASQFTASNEIDVINEREKLKETDEYKRAMEEEWASRQRQLQIQQEEAQRLRKRKKAESQRLVDMQRRQKESVEKLREARNEDEENMNMKEQLRNEIRKELSRMEITCTDMASLLRSLGIQVGGGLRSSSDEVKAAYRQALFKFHPDRASRTDIRDQVEAEEKFKLISRMKEKFL